MAEWLKGPLRDLMMGLLDGSRLRRQALLDPVPVAALVSDHLSGRRDNRKELCGPC